MLYEEDIAVFLPFLLQFLLALPTLVVGDQHDEHSNVRPTHEDGIFLDLVPLL